MKFFSKKALVAMALVSSTGAFAAEGSGVTFTLHLPMVTYQSTASETKVGAVTAKETTTDLNMGSGYALKLSWDKWTVYANSGGNYIKAGYFLQDNLELDVLLGLNTHNEDKAKKSSTDNTYGVAAIYSMPMGSATMEYHGGITMTSATSKNDSATPPTKTNNVGSEINLGALYVCDIMKNLQYTGGLSYTMSTDEDKETKVKTTANTLGIQLLGLRASFN